MRTNTKRTVEEKKEIVILLDEAKKNNKLIAKCTELGVANPLYYAWKKKYFNTTEIDKPIKSKHIGTKLDTYIINNYQTVPVRDICHKFGVAIQIVNGGINRLNNLNLIDKSKTFNKVLGKGRINRKYSNESGIGKAEVRTVVVNLITQDETYKPKILTLPAANWAWEKQICKKKAARFIAVEKDRNTFIEMSRNYLMDETLIKSVMSVNNCTMGEMIHKSEENEYDHAILDYCGTINTFYNEINEALQNNIVKFNGLIAITLSKNGFNNELGIVKDYLTTLPNSEFNSKDSDSVYAIKGLFSHLILKNDFRYKVEKLIEYCDTSPMIVFVLRRIV